MKNIIYGNFRSKLFIYFLSFLIGYLTLISCNSKDGDMSLMQNAKKSARLQKTSEIHKEMLKKVKNGHFNFGRIDGNLIKNGIKNCKSKQDVIALYKKSGMTNAEEYIEMIDLQMNEIKTMVQENPDYKDKTNGKFKADMKEKLNQGRDIFSNSKKQ